MPDANQFVGVFEWQGSKQHTVHHAEDGGVRADSEGKRNDGRAGEAGIFDECSHAVTDVLKCGLDVMRSAKRAVHLAELLHHAVFFHVLFQLIRGEEAAQLVQAVVNLVDGPLVQLVFAHPPGRQRLPQGLVGAEEGDVGAVQVPVRGFHVQQQVMHGLGLPECSNPPARPACCMP